MATARSEETGGHGDLDSGLMDSDIMDSRRVVKGERRWKARRGEMRVDYGYGELRY